MCAPCRERQDWNGLEGKEADPRVVARVFPVSYLNSTPVMRALLDSGKLELFEVLAVKLVAKSTHPPSWLCCA